MSKTLINWVSSDWKRIKNHCRTTVNKEATDYEPSTEFKRQLLVSEHSPIRLLEVDWSWKDIPSWVSVHWVRHKFEKFVSTQRDDRKKHTIPRGQMPQDTPVNFDGYANAQNLIDAWRKRLCYQASPETRMLAEDFKRELKDFEPELSDVLVPNCIYRCGCPEFNSCGFFNTFVNQCEDKVADNLVPVLLTNVRSRYSMYNKIFWDEIE